jgi:hypothetical protein
VTMLTQFNMWRSQLRPIHVYKLVLALAVLCGISVLAGAGVWAHALLQVCSLGFVAWSIMITKLNKSEWLIRVWGKITGLTPVRIMQYDHEVRLSLMSHTPDGAWEGYLGWQFNEGHMRLLPNGHVDPHCVTTFCYVWQPLDPELCTQLQLAYWELWPNWDEWLQKSHKQMVVYRLTHLNG